ncbi:hypothetical protein RIN61_00020 [Pseudomonas inefficax]|uniref:hypothetical protein n=1 Tax=Pseudomonas inefficax TaxID=2078786 RepID=UPI0028BEC896|nr:hypothetical protein [Pseudomonas inefficax]WNN39720.1 hypothetical protein RIN61_26640 [Pseudomonas inefficax]WNN39728.1 hypothetical protein RIN61_00020 [Pseudomonas inefficax]
MSKKPKNRLPVSLNQIQLWASDDLIVRSETLTSYIENGGSLDLACGELHRFGMNSIGNGLQYATKHTYNCASLDFISGIAKRLVADLILIRNLEKSRQMAIEDLDESPLVF